MVTYARELKGVTKKELAESLRKTPATISRIESGDLRPDIETFFSLSRVLNVEPQFLSRDENDFLAFDISRIHFRGQRKASATQKKMLIRQGEAVSDVFNFFKKRGISFPSDNISDLSTPAQTQYDIEELSIELRKRLNLGFGPISNLTNSLECNGYTIIKLENGHGFSIDAFSSMSGKTPTIVLCPHESSSRALFSIAHEIGHLLLHEYTDGSMQQEKEANYFASSFLMPWKSFKDECPKRWNYTAFSELKKRWKLSIGAMLYRAKQLNIFSDSTYIRAIKQMKYSGTSIHEPNEPDTEKVSLFSEAISLLIDNNIKINEIEEQTGHKRKNIIDILIAQDVDQELVSRFIPGNTQERKPLVQMMP